MRLVCCFLVLAEGLAVLHDKSQHVRNFIVFIIIKFTNKHSSWLHQLIRGRPASADASVVVFLCKYAESIVFSMVLLPFLPRAFPCRHMERLGEVSRAFVALSFSLQLIEGTELPFLEPRRQLLQDMRLRFFASSESCQKFHSCAACDRISLIFHINEVVSHWGYHEGIFFFFF